MKIFKYMALALAAVLSVGCMQEQFELDPNKVPSASDLQVKIDVDQATNYVTFSIDNQGMVPMWLFGTEKIDGKANKKYAYTGNGISLRLRDAGTHSVEVKAYNAHGVSIGSKVVEFTLENTYRDPFDPSKYFTFFAGSTQKVWEWNSTVKGHFGCGEPGTDGTNWWSAGPDEKKDWGLYDDRLTFTADRKYTYNPGEGGMVYVNKDSGYGPSYNTNDGNDYMVPIEEFSTDYTFENAWNDAGIEEVFLVLPEGKNLSYIPNPEALAEPRYKILEGTNTKKLALVHDNGAIAWKYEFVLEGSAKPEDPEPGTGDVFDPDSDRNMWKNAVTTDHHFWFADENWGTIENATITSNGNYHEFVLPAGIGSQQWQGQFFFQNTGIATSAVKTYDFYCVLNSDADHAGVTVKLCAQDDDGAIISDGRYALKAFEDYVVRVVAAPGIDCENLKLVLDFGGGQGGSKVIVKDIILQEHIDAGGPAPFDPSSPDNLWSNAVTTDHHFWFADENWGAIENATITSDGGTYTFGLPVGLGSQQWQGQFFFQNTGLKSEASKTYDFHLVLMAEADHAGVTVKLCAQDDDAAIITDGRYALTAYEEFSLDVYGAQGIDCENLKLVFDFGGGQGGTNVIVKDIVFRESKTTPSPEPEKPGFDPNAGTNLWLSMNVEEMFYYYAPGWAQIDNPEVTQDGNSYTISLPEATTDQWQAQVAFRTDLSSSADKKYDFYCVIQSNNDLPGVTIKLTKTGDDNTFYFADRHDIKAYEDYVYVVQGMAGIDMEKISLFFDFGGNPAATEVIVKDIVFREAVEGGSNGGSDGGLDPSSPDNMWLSMNVEEMFYYYAPGWAQIDNPEVAQDGNSYTISLPEATTDQWQAQVAFRTDMSSQAGKKYDFYCVLQSNNDISGVTIKLTKTGDDNSFYFADRHNLAAYEDYVYQVVGMDGIDMEKISLFFDFGGNPAGTEVTVSDILFQEHK